MVLNFLRSFAVFLSANVINGAGPFTIALLTVAAVGAQGEEPLWPGAKYDPAIPTLRQVVGHDPGNEITSPDQIGQYLQALAKAAPTRTRLSEYARTWEGRPLWLMAIGSAEHIARLDQIKADAKRLRSPRTAVE
jgi:Zinc carboxypeptidase